MTKLIKFGLKMPVSPRSRDLGDLCKKLEILQIHRLSESFFYATTKFIFRTNDIQPKDLIGVGPIRMNEIINQNDAKNEFICFTRFDLSKERQNIFKNPNVMITPPIILEENFFRITFISFANNVDFIIEEHGKQFSDQLRILNITPIQTDKKNLSFLLTEKQKSIMYYAIENGYYEIPRKIYTTAIANHFKISRSAVCEHLRKIERTTFQSLFS